MAKYKEGVIGNIFKVKAEEYLTQNGIIMLLNFPVLEYMIMEAKVK